RHVEVQDWSTVMSEPNKDEHDLGADRVCIVKKSVETSWDAWLVRNVFHVCDGRFRCRTMYFATDACEIVIPSLTSSPMRSTVISGGGYVATIFGCLHYFPS